MKRNALALAAAFAALATACVAFLGITDVPASATTEELETAVVRAAAAGRTAQAHPEVAAPRAAVPRMAATARAKEAALAAAADPIDFSYNDFGNVLTAGGGGYWLISSDVRPGQPAGSNGLADVLLLHSTAGATDGGLPLDRGQITLASDPNLNDRAPHLAKYGASHLLAAWETSTATGVLAAGDVNRKLYVQTLDASTGASVGAPFNVVGITGNRFQDFRAFPDGSVPYAAPGSTNTKIKILRILPCP